MAPKRSEYLAVDGLFLIINMKLIKFDKTKRVKLKLVDHLQNRLYTIFGLNYPRISLHTQLHKNKFS